MRTVYIPANLDLPALLEKHPSDFAFELEDFYYILGTIVQRMEYWTYNVDSASAFATVNAQILQSRVRQYNYYLKYLLEHGIIETDNHVIVGVKSRGYKLKDEFTSEGFVPVTLKTRRLIRARAEEIRNRRNLNREYKHLIKWFDGLELDFEAACAYLQSNLDDEIARHGKEAALRRYHLLRMSLARIQAGNYFFHVDDKGRRLHTNLTTLKSELRNFLTFKGKPLCSVDVKNSQPFISTILLNPAF